MPTTAFPSIITAVTSVVTSAIAATPAEAVRGRVVSDDPADVVMVGVTDDGDSASDAGAFQQTLQTFGGNREEVGQVNCRIVAWNGEADQDAACSTAFDYLALIETAVRTAPTLGLTAFDYVFAELQAGDVAESQTDAGATTALTFTITYKVRI